MPVYEFYCGNCHMQLSFFSRRIDTTTRPSCPHCQRPQLKRQLSLFNTGGQREASSQVTAAQDSAVRSLGEQLAGLDQDNNRTSAELASALYAARGVRPGEAMQTALSRLEAGVDPIEIETALGDAIDTEADVRVTSTSTSTSPARLDRAVATDTASHDRQLRVDPVTYPLNGDADE